MSGSSFIMSESSTEDKHNRPAGHSARPAPQMRRSSLSVKLKLFWQFLIQKPADTVPQGSIPVLELSAAALLDAPDGSLWRLGHSTLLMKIQSGFWITDPVFSERASPFQWLGPKRFHAPPISLGDLPSLRGVILSHDHYDHLDKASILALNQKTDLFLTPDGVGKRLTDWGIPADKVRQLGWWESTEADGIEFVATPARHFSGRGLHDRNQTLWASWTILAPEHRIFFSGDSGYFPGFREIGERYGPFDLTLIETGAYNEHWPDIHMHPTESLQAHLDLRGRHMLPIHNGTFDLSLHTWYDPFEQIIALAQQHRVRISTPQMGEMIDIAEPQAGQAWWRFPNARRQTMPLAAVLAD